MTVSQRWDLACLPRFKSFEYLRTVIYLVAGKINFPLFTQS